MANRSWRSGSKQPSPTREPQKEAKKKTLEDTCKGLKKNIAMENIAMVSAEKRRQDQDLEDEQMRMIYGPNWRVGLPQWASEANKEPVSERVPFSNNGNDLDDDDDEYGKVVPIPQSSETRLMRRRKAS